MKAMTYKDYTGSAEVSVEDGVLHGRLLGIRDLVTYEADTPAGLEAAFREAVDDYLADCAEEERKPDKPFKGSLNVRIGADLHRQVAMEAFERHMSLNDLLVRKLRMANAVQNELATGDPSPEKVRAACERALAAVRASGVDMPPATVPGYGRASKPTRAARRP